VIPACALVDAIREDAPALARLEALCHTHPWTAAHFQQSVAHGTTGRRTLLLRGPRAPGDPLRGILAYCVVEVVLDEAHVHNLAVRPDLRRRGLARWLLLRTLALVVRQGVTAAFLEVRRSNRAALELYGGLGFRQVGIRRGYYRQPAEDALVLRRDGLPDPSATAPADEP
jgi:[ribosomal protein S18]-alanine N-acetyltransferase